MICKKLLGVVLGVGLVFAVVQVRGQDLTAIEGSWKPSQGTLSGNPISGDVLDRMALEFSSGQFRANSGTWYSNGTVRLGQSGQVTFNIDGGADAGKAVKAIFKVVNDQLVLTYSRDSEFPTDFDSTSDNKYWSLTFNRSAGGGPGPGPGGSPNFGSNPGVGPPGASDAPPLPGAGGGAVPSGKGAILGGSR